MNHYSLKPFLDDKNKTRYKFIRAWHSNSFDIWLTMVISLSFTIKDSFRKSDLVFPNKLYKMFFFWIIKEQFVLILASFFCSLNYIMGILTIFHFRSF